MYRALRSLERDALVRSGWAPSSGGPDRRIYELTPAGIEELHRLAQGLAGARDVLDVFLARYGEFASLADGAERVSR